MATLALITFVLALISVVSGAMGTITGLYMYKRPTQRRVLTRLRTGCILSLAFGVLAGASEMLLLGFLSWLGLYALSTSLIASTITAMFAAAGTYGGWTIGVKVFERRMGD